MAYLIYCVAALAEISGCFAFRTWLKLGRSPFWVAPGMMSLALFARLLTLILGGAAGRAYAAYGGLYIAASIMWLWIVEGQRPDRFDVAGALMCLAGTAVILFPARSQQVPGSCTDRIAKRPAGGGSRSFVWRGSALLALAAARPLLRTIVDIRPAFIAHAGEQENLRFAGLVLPFGQFGEPFFQSYYVCHSHLHWTGLRRMNLRQISSCQFRQALPGPRRSKTIAPFSFPQPSLDSYNARDRLSVTHETGWTANINAPLWSVIRSCHS